MELKTKALMFGGSLAALLALATCGGPKEDDTTFCGYQPGNDSRVLVMQEPEDSRDAATISSVGFYIHGLETSSDGADSYNRGYPVLEENGFDDSGTKRYNISFLTKSGRVQVYKDEAGVPTSCVTDNTDSQYRSRFDQARVNRAFPEYMAAEAAAREADPLYDFDSREGYRPPSDKAMQAMRTAVHNFRFERDEATNRFSVPAPKR